MSLPAKQVNEIDQPLPMRHPLGLPPGSVRALLTFMILGIVWVLLLLPEEKAVPVPVYLFYLMFLVLGDYFALRSQSPVSGSNERAPLFLPRGTIRLLIILSFVGVMGWGIYSNDKFLDRLKPSMTVLTEQPFLPLIILGAFFLGSVITRISSIFLKGPRGLPPWYQDLQAWISLVAMLALGAEVLIQLVIYPSVEESMRFELPGWQSILSGIIAFYFGARS